MNRTIATIVNGVLSVRSKKAEEFVFVVNNREYVLYPDGNIWRRKRGRDWIKKFSFNGSTWVTDKGRPALVIKDMTTKLVRRLETMAPKFGRGTRTRLPKGAKPTPQKIPKNKIDRISSRKKDRPIGEVLKVARRLVRKLKKLGFSGIEIAGSLRRKDAVVGDIDIMAIGNASIIKTAAGLQFIKGGKKSVTFMFEGHQVNLYSYKKSYYGAMLLFLTGPAKFGIILRRRAKNMELKLNQYGLWDIKDNKLLAARTEERIFKKLKMEYKKPELRGREKIKKTRKSDLEPTSPPERISVSKLNDKKHSQEEVYKYIRTLSEQQIVKLMDMAAIKYYNK